MPRNLKETGEFITALAVLVVMLTVFVLPILLAAWFSDKAAAKNDNPSCESERAKHT